MNQRIMFSIAHCGAAMFGPKSLREQIILTRQDAEGLYNDFNGGEISGESIEVQLQDISSVVCS